jgi:hypothetical protein
MKIPTGVTTGLLLVLAACSPTPDSDTLKHQVQAPLDKTQAAVDQLEQSQADEQARMAAQAGEDDPGTAEEDDE